MKHLKNITIISLLFLLTLSFVGCGSSYPKPDESIKSFFTAMEKKDLKTASIYLKDAGSIDEFTKKNNVNNTTLELLSKAKCEILSSKVEGDTATAKVKVTAPDSVALTKISIKEAIPTIMNSSNNKKNDAETIFANALIKHIKDPKVKTISKEIEIKLSKNEKDNNWLINMSDSFRDAMTGDLIKASDLLNKM